MEGDKMVAAKVAMGEPTFIPDEIPVNTAEIGDLEIIKDFPLTDIGPHVEHHPLFPNRVNFEIVNVITRSQIRARIFERGAGETMSSGTGSTAAASAARAHGLVNNAVDVIVDGGILKISWDETGQAYLEGPAVEVFTGVWPD